MTTSKTKVLLGRIVGAHGIRGEVVVHSYAAEPADIAAYGPLASADGHRQFELSGVRISGKSLVARVNGITDRTVAETLKGTDLYVDRTQLPPPADGEFYVSDLIGLQAVDETGRKVGAIVDAPDYGAGPLLEIRIPGRAQTELIPFTDTYVPVVDLAAGHVQVRRLVYATESTPPGDATAEGE